MASAHYSREIKQGDQTHSILCWIASKDDNFHFGVSLFYSEHVNQMPLAEPHRSRRGLWKQDIPNKWGEFIKLLGASGNKVNLFLTAPIGCSTEQETQGLCYIYEQAKRTVIQCTFTCVHKTGHMPSHPVLNLVEKKNCSEVPHSFLCWCSCLFGNRQQGRTCVCVCVCEWLTLFHELHSQAWAIGAHEREHAHYHDEHARAEHGWSENQQLLDVGQQVPWRHLL